MSEEMLAITLERLAQSPIALGLVVALFMQILFKGIIDKATRGCNPKTESGDWLWRDTLVNVVVILLALLWSFVAKGVGWPAVLHAILGAGVAAFGYEGTKNIVEGVKEDLKWR